MVTDSHSNLGIEIYLVMGLRKLTNLDSRKVRGMAIEMRKG